MGVRVDGISDYYVRGGDLTGNSDAKTGLVSSWINPGTDGVRGFILQNDGGRIIFEREVANTLKFLGTSPAPGAAMTFRSVATVLAANGWAHVMSSWALATATIQLYVNDVASLSIVVNNDVLIDYTRPNWAVGAVVGGASPYNGGLAEVYFTNEHLDLSVEANRRKFINADGSPNTDLGSDGSKPTGTAPLIYLSGGKDAFPVNRGTGGSFSVAGGAPLTIPFPAPENTRARTRHRLGADYYR